MQNPNSYTIVEHVDRLAAWAASRAAASAPRNRFPVQKGKAILESAGFDRLVGDPDLLPSPETTDVVHRQWRDCVRGAAREEGLAFSHGMAAKLINCYLKVAFVTVPLASHPRVGALHPPVDRLLLSGLAVCDPPRAVRWRRLRDAAWSRFDSDTYEEAIALIREYLGDGVALWRVEHAWQGYQGSSAEGADEN